MARPVSRSQKEETETVLYTCLGNCGESKPLKDFYKSNNKLFKTKIVPYCKNCTKEMIYHGGKVPDEKYMKQYLEMVNLPFLRDVWEKVLVGKTEPVGSYIRNIGFNIVTRDFVWKDSDFEEKKEETKTSPKRKVKKSDFKVTDEIVEMFGDGYSDEEYRLFEKKYLMLKDNYPQQTAMHTEAFLKYIRYAVKEEMSIAENDADEAKKWGEQANKAAIAAKINPNQLSKSDLQGGINTISEIALAVEQAKDVIEILPRFKYRPNDAIDFLLFEYINYERKLSGMPLCEYEDIYKFYDERVKQFIENGGDASLFTNDPTQENRERVKKFINLPEDYNESDSVDLVDDLP